MKQYGKRDTRRFILEHYQRRRKCGLTKRSVYVLDFVKRKKLSSFDLKKKFDFKENSKNNSNLKSLEKMAPVGIGMKKLLVRRDNLQLMNNRRRNVGKIFQIKNIRQKSLLTASLENGVIKWGGKKSQQLSKKRRDTSQSKRAKSRNFCIKNPQNLKNLSKSSASFKFNPNNHLNIKGQKWDRTSLLKKHKKLQIFPEGKKSKSKSKRLVKSIEPVKRRKFFSKTNKGFFQKSSKSGHKKGSQKHKRSKTDSWITQFNFFFKKIDDKEKSEDNQRNTELENLYLFN
jgi:hypothetical protein